MLQRIFQEPKFRVCCLGALKLVEASSGTDFTPATRKTRALIGYLAVVGKPVGRERLASLLWGDRGDEQARASLRQAIYELRSTLGGNRLLKVERDTVAAGEEVGTDIAAIEAAAQSGDLEQLSHALSDWRGGLFEDLGSLDPSFDTWLQAERLRVPETLIAAAAEAAKAGMARGEIDPARKIVNLLQQHDATNEVVLRLGLRLDCLAGDSTALHRRYERFRELLKSELNAAPAPETQRLFQELTATSPEAAPPAVPITDRANEVPEPAQAGGSVSAGHPTAQGPLSALADAAAPVSPPRTHSGYRLLLAAAACAVALLCVLGWIVWNHKAAAPRQEPLLAVLPFQNLSADPGSRYFSDGITAEIVDALLRATQVRVVSPVSSFRFRNAGAAKAAKVLAATHVLSGSVERTGDRIHLLAQLTDMRDHSVVWSHAYDRSIEQAPALRRDVAVQIADALDMRLSPVSLDEEARISPAAYDRYLKGRDLFLQRDLEAAEPELEAATRLAPGFAKAWSTLAAVRIVRVSTLFSERKQDDEAAMEKAAAMAAHRALALDPRNGEALAVLAHLTPATHLQDVDGLFRRALQSEPNDTQLLNWHGAFLWFVGRHREALDELTRAYDIDRTTPSIAQNLANALLWVGRYKDVKDIVDLSGDNRLRREFFQLHAEYFLFRRDWAGLTKDLKVLPDYLPPRQAAFFGLYRDTASALAQNQREQFGPLRLRWRNAIAFGTDDAVQFLSALGDSDGALQSLDAAVAEHLKQDRYLIDPGWTALLPANLTALRRDPRVPLLFFKWGLFDYWRKTDRWPDFCYEPGLPFDCKREAQKLARERRL